MTALRPFPGNDLAMASKSPAIPINAAPNGESLNCFTSALAMNSLNLFDYPNRCAQYNFPKRFGRKGSRPISVRA